MTMFFQVLTSSYVTKNAELEVKRLLHLSLINGVIKLSYLEILEFPEYHQGKAHYKLPQKPN